MVNAERLRMMKPNHYSSIPDAVRSSTNKTCRTLNNGTIYAAGGTLQSLPAPTTRLLSPKTVTSLHIVWPATPRERLANHAGEYQGLSRRKTSERMKQARVMAIIIPANPGQAARTYIRALRTLISTMRLYLFASRG